MIVTQQQYKVLKQPIIKRYIKLYLLNFNLQRVNEISGNLIGCSVSGDGNSDLRHNCNVSLVVTDSSFDIKSGGQIWLDKYIQPYIGTVDISTNEIVWENQGVYLINAPTWDYDSITNTLSFSGLDLVSKLTGLRNGELEGLPTTISQGENVREAIIATLALAGFTNYIVSECVNEDGVIQEVPYDLTVKQGSTVWDLLKLLRDILPQYQMYFDKDGVFHYELIPSGQNMPSLFDDDLIYNILTKEKINTDFESIKNYIEVYGKVHSIEFYSIETTIETLNSLEIVINENGILSLKDSSNNILPFPINSKGELLSFTINNNGIISYTGNGISLTIPNLQTLSPYVMIGFMLNSNVNNGIYLNVNNNGLQPLVDYSNNIIESLEVNTYYVAQYQENGTWLFLGHLQPQAIYYDNNPDSPFYYDPQNPTANIGMIRHVCTGGDYDNIQSDYLALQRAKLEIYWRCRLNNSISLNVIPIPWIEVNTLFTHAIKGGENKEQWIIDKYSVDYSETGEMTIVAHKYYPYYPII